MFDQEGSDGRRDDSLAVSADFDSQSHSQPANLKHASAEGGAADGPFDRFHEITSALNESFAGVRFEDENVVIVVEGAGADGVELGKIAQSDAVQRRAELGETVE